MHLGALHSRHSGLADAGEGGLQLPLTRVPYERLKEDLPESGNLQASRGLQSLTWLHLRVSIGSITVVDLVSVGGESTADGDIVGAAFGRPGTHTSQTTDRQ